jgi:aquaporin TIP
VQHVPTYTIAEEMTRFGASLLECILAFALVYTIYATRDTRHGTMGAIGPLAIGFIAGANVLAAGPFSGGSMNSACAFRSAITTSSFKNQAVY